MRKGKNILFFTKIAYELIKSKKLIVNFDIKRINNNNTAVVICDIMAKRGIAVLFIQKRRPFGKFKRKKLCL